MYTPRPSAPTLKCYNCVLIHRVVFEKIVLLNVFHCPILLDIIRQTTHKSFNDLNEFRDYASHHQKNQNDRHRSRYGDFRNPLSEKCSTTSTSASDPRVPGNQLMDNCD
ncbi:hypothetical protein EVAR_17019_1 [Eumeta japonica]|uniref:Uncharacterized protein n=1 Tax=Eumeta variegata TaxID=151549 RepID=A0A4C1TVK5_EUMVA|nr:hypothetical protein EVAR_17019_1 [Eumeta japonica]